jgi:hypothetical protein
MGGIHMKFKTIYHTILPSDGHVPTTRIQLGKEYMIEHYPGESTFHIYDLELPVVYNMTFTINDGTVYEEFGKYFYTEQQMIEKMRGDKLDSII